MITECSTEKKCLLVKDPDQLDVYATEKNLVFELHNKNSVLDYLHILLRRFKQYIVFKRKCGRTSS